MAAHLVRLSILVIVMVAPIAFLLADRGVAIAAMVELTVKNRGPNAGAVSVVPLALLCNPYGGGDCTFSIPAGTPLTLSANAPFGSTPGIFSGGTGSAAGCAASTCRFTIRTDSEITATFDAAVGVHEALEIALTGDGTGHVAANNFLCTKSSASPVSCVTTYGADSVATLTVQPDAGSRFEWVAGVCEGGGACRVSLPRSRRVVGEFRRTDRPLPREIWIPNAPMPTARHAVALAAVRGRLYAIGGFGVGGQVGINEMYDPRTDRWTSKSPLPSTPTDFAGTNAAVVGGRIYVIGGNASGACTSAVRVYHPASDTWSEKTPMPTPRCHLAVVALNGLIYAIGGTNTSGSFNYSTVEVYDPAADAWSGAAPMPTPRSLIGAGVVNGRIHVIGGSGPLATNESYDPATGQWTTKAPMPAPRSSVAVAALDGRLYAAGGDGGNGQWLSTVAAYNPSTDTWQTKPSLLTARSMAAAAVVDEVLYVVGGYDSREVAANEALVDRRVTLTVQKAGTGVGTVRSAPGGIVCGADCSSAYLPGTEVTLTADPQPGSVFVRWSGSACAAAPSCTVVLSRDTTITAEFDLVARVTLTVERAGNAAGTVTSDPVGIDCGTDCSARYAHGTRVTLMARPTHDSEFAGWTGGGCGAAPTCSMRLTSDRTVTAIFNLRPQVSLTVLKRGTGTGIVTSSPPGISCGVDCEHPFAVGAHVTLTAQAADGSTFGRWNVNECGAAPTCVVALSRHTTVTATFDTAAARVALRVRTTGGGTGRVLSDPSGITCGADCTALYPIGTAVTLSATPSVGSVFSGWSGAGCAGVGTCRVTMNVARTVIATFHEDTRTLKVRRSGSGGGTVTSSPAGIACGTECNASFSRDTTVTLTAEPASRAEFAGWQGACSGSSASCTVVMSTAREVTASFARALPLTVTLNGAGSGTVTSLPTGIACAPDCNHLYREGSVVRLAATPSAGSTFVGWSAPCEGAFVCTLTVTAATSITATFERGDSLLAESINYLGPLPPLSNVRYPTRAGEIRTMTGAYEGLVDVFVDANASRSDVAATIEANGGSIAASIPLVGHYTIEVLPRHERAFLAEMYRQPWFRDGFPTAPAALADKEMLDWNTIGIIGTSDCHIHHAELTTRIAQRRGGATEFVDLSFARGFTDLFGKTLEYRMERAHGAGRRVVFGLPTAWGTAVGQSPCITPACQDIQAGQRNFWRRFFDLMEETALRQPDIANNVILVISAGNHGVPLDAEIAALRTQFPNAASRIVIVGGTDAATPPQIFNGYNHLLQNVANPPRMVYSRALNVISTGSTPCSGTSFAAPEVVSVLDAIWAIDRRMTSAQIVAAFNEAVRELRTNGVLPQDGNGRTTRAFIERAAEIARRTLGGPETYRGFATLGGTHTWPNDPNCVPNPYVTTSTSPQFAFELRVDRSLLTGGAIVGTYNSASFVETTTFPAETCTLPDGSTYVVPASASTYTWPADTGRIDGTSDGHNVSFIVEEPLNDEHTLTGTVATVGGEIRLRGRYEGRTSLGDDDSFTTIIEFDLTRR